MATDIVKTASITNLDATPIVRADSWKHGGRGKHFVGTVECTAAAAAASTYRMFRIGSWMRPSSITLAQDVISAGAFDIGLYGVNSGAAVAISVFASTISAGAATLDTAVLFKGKDIADAEKRVWELLGLTTDPNLEYDVVLTAAQALGNAGTLTAKATFTW